MITDSHDVLIIEDNSGDAIILQEAFQRAASEISVYVERDGATALTHLTSSRSLPRMILLDLKLPRMSGMEVLRKLKADDRLRTIPVIILSSSQAPGDILNAYQLHCNAYLRKPSDFLKLVDIVSLLSNFWLREVLQP